MTDTRLLIASSYSDLNNIVNEEHLVGNIQSGIDDSIIVFCGRIISSSLSNSLDLIILLNETKINLGSKFVILIDEISLQFFTSLYSSRVENGVIFSEPCKSDEIFDILSEVFKNFYVPNCLFADELEQYLEIIKFLSNVKRKYPMFKKFFFLWKNELIERFFDRTKLHQSEDYIISKEIVQSLEYENLEKETDILFAIMFIYRKISDLYDSMTLIFRTSQIFFIYDKTLLMSMGLYNEKTRIELSILYNNVKNSIENGVFLPNGFVFDLEEKLRNLSLDIVSQCLYIRDLSQQYNFLIVGDVENFDTPVPIKIGNDCVLIYTLKKNCFYSSREIGKFTKFPNIEEGNVNPFSFIMIHKNKFSISGKTSCGKKYIVNKPANVMVTSKSLKYEQAGHKTGRYWIYIPNHGYYNLTKTKNLFKEKLPFIKPEKDPSLSPDSSLRVMRGFFEIY